VVLLVVRLEFAEHLRGVDEVPRLVFLVADHQHVVLGPGAVERGLVSASIGRERSSPVTSAPVCPVSW